MSNTDASSASNQAESLRSAMRKLWCDHVIWTRDYIIGATDGGHGLTDVAEHLPLGRLGSTVATTAQVALSSAPMSGADQLSEMSARATAAHYNFPYLKDADANVARSYGAVCTPHAFLLDSDRRIAYRGRIEDARDPLRVSARDLESAIGDVLAGRTVSVAETDPYGCSIVW